MLAIIRELTQFANYTYSSRTGFSKCTVRELYIFWGIVRELYPLFTRSVSSQPVRELYIQFANCIFESIVRELYIYNSRILHLQFANSRCTVREL